MRPQEVFPTRGEVLKDPQKWNKRSITYHGEKRYYDQDVRKGECYFCHLYGRTQNYDRQTYIHHLAYDDDEPIMWTLELCSGCHYKLDEKNRRQVSRSYWKKDDARRFVENEMRRTGLRRY